MRSRRVSHGLFNIEMRKVSKMNIVATSHLRSCTWHSIIIYSKSWNTTKRQYHNNVKLVVKLAKQSRYEIKIVTD